MRASYFCIQASDWRKKHLYSGKAPWNYPLVTHVEEAQKCSINNIYSMFMPAQLDPKSSKSFKFWDTEMDGLE